MELIEKMVQNIDIEDLREKIVCERCIAAGLSFEVALHYRGDMQASPSTQDLICLHCYDTEIDLGYDRLTKKEIAYVGKLIGEFEKFKKIRLNQDT